MRLMLASALLTLTLAAVAQFSVPDSMVGQCNGRVCIVPMADAVNSILERQLLATLLQTAREENETLKDRVEELEAKLTTVKCASLQVTEPSRQVGKR